MFRADQKSQEGRSEILDFFYRRVSTQPLLKFKKTQQKMKKTTKQYLYYA
jgi:hypothetical protein